MVFRQVVCRFKIIARDIVVGYGYDVKEAKKEALAIFYESLDDLVKPKATTLECILIESDDGDELEKALDMAVELMQDMKAEEACKELEATYNIKCTKVR